MSAGVWQQATTADGKVYYWNTVTKATQWIKPEELNETSEQDPMKSQPWTQYFTPDNKAYYHNAESKATVWEEPPIHAQARAKREAKDTVQIKSEPSTRPSFVAGGLPSQPQPFLQHRDRDRDRDDRDRRDDRRDDRDDRRDYNRHDRDRRDDFRSSFVPAATNEVEYRSFEEAEEAFMSLMKRNNVQLDWTWEDAMKATIMDSQFRALKDPTDRKMAFDKYLVEQRAQNKEREKERVDKLRRDFTTMLESHPEISHETRWSTARPIIEGETIFRSTGSDTERRQLFEEYVQRLRKQYAESQATNRKSAIDELSGILRSLDLEPYVRWADAQGRIDSNERFRSDAKFKSLTKADVLTAFDHHVRYLERTFNDQRQLTKHNKIRTERQSRDGFMALLRELQSQRKIQAGAKWMEVLPSIEDDKRYHAVLAQSGSTPLDLFWDTLEEEERLLRGKRNHVLDVLDAKEYEITVKTTSEEFMEVVRDDERTRSVSDHELKLIFGRLHAKVVLRAEEDKHHAERVQRRAVDSLRSRIKHLEPPIRISDSWEEDVRPRLESSAEYRAIESEEGRRSAFDKYIRRLKEKEAEAEAERSRRAERDRSHTNGHRRGRDGHSRTPEIDVYEAERRKATAAREKQYHRSSATGLSPPPAESSRRRERYDERDRYERGRLSSGYERERHRAQDYDREHSYISRADPRDSGAKELDYGDGRAGSMTGSTGRRRRRSDADDDERARISKIVKRERGSKTPAAEEVKIKQEEEELKSGSEEGEIEEV